jgi:hypothetical protein
VEGECSTFIGSGGNFFIFISISIELEMVPYSYFPGGVPFLLQLPIVLLDGSLPENAKATL